MAISAQCPECQRDVNSNKRGSRSLVKAQATARVDVPTAPFSFAVRVKESKTSASFCANAWVCACQTTDHDLESSNTMKKVNAWICAAPTTDHDPTSVIHDKKRKSATTVISCGPNDFGINKFRIIFQ